LHARSAAQLVAPPDPRAQAAAPSPRAPADVHAAELAEPVVAEPVVAEPALAEPALVDPAAEPRPQDDASMRLHAHVGYQLMAQALPEPMAAIALGVDLGFTRRFSLVLSVLAAPDSDFGLGQGRTHIEFVAGRVLACASWLMPARLGVSSCAGGVAGRVSVAGAGYAVANRQSSAPWVAGLAGGSVYYPDAGPIALRLSARGVINAVRPAMWVRSGPSESTAHGSLVGFESSIELLIQLT
jgi:hypothetical protein